MIGLSVCQSDRDLLADQGLIGDDGLIGTGDGAEHYEVVTAADG